MIAISPPRGLAKLWLRFALLGCMLSIAVVAGQSIGEVVNMDCLHYHPNRLLGDVTIFMVLSLVSVLFDSELSIIVGAIIAAVFYQRRQRVPLYSMALMFPACCVAMYIQGVYVSLDQTVAWVRLVHIDIWLLSAVILRQLSVLFGFWLFSNSTCRLVPRVALTVFFCMAVNLGANMLHAWGITPDRVLLAYNKSSYLRQVANVQQTARAPIILQWRWRDCMGPLAVSSCTFYYLVYDDSDQIVLPPAARSADWQRSFQASSPNDFVNANSDWEHDIHIRKLDGHFYLLVLSV